MITQNYPKIIAEIDSRAKLIVVTKTRSLKEIQTLIKLGHLDFGENKIQDLSEKASLLKEYAPKWHFIGNLQSNKINALLALPGLLSIHSIDSIKLLHKLLSKKLDKRIGLFLQVNTSNEEQKAGFESIDLIREAIELIEGHSSFYFQGLMTMGKIRTDHFEEEARASFSKLNDIKKIIVSEYKVACELSMGMSRDYKIALDYKSDWLRIGSKIFE